MKKIISIILFVLLINIPVLASESAEENIIKSIAPFIDTDNCTKISRGDCIATVMQLIGVDKEISEIYADLDFNQSVFYDIDDDRLNAGYIILAKYSGVAVGVNTDTYDIGNFEPNREVTIKECLAFMLRCLKKNTEVKWGNILSDAEKFGLLQSSEVKYINDDQLLIGGTFRILLERMLNMNRYLYWPLEEPAPGYAKSMQVDQVGEIQYIDWILENKL